MQNLTQEDYKNILALIAKAQITGQDAIVVAVLQQKLSRLLTPTEPTNEEGPKSKKEA